ncbi:putative ABC multidrug transporter [Achaetomium macrosporum]|uniref:ABC multidrug transporter n=1 Tax=Achaetomium macrosporum TaxID=79813 RepID=A0AAN7H743_9PEZI|nr:putative ABC multidrug transporter [Achaetomium macrosporum]
MNFMSRQAMWLEAIEKRISATSAMLASMKGVKICGSKDALLASLQQLRVDELRISKRFKKLIIWNMVFAYLTQVFAPVLTFTIFSVRARDSGDATLDTARVFTLLSLFALLSEPLASLVMSLATYLGAIGSFVRIQQFLDSEERADSPSPGDLAELSEKSILNQSAPNAIAVQGASFGWDAAKEPLLKDITLAVPCRKLTMVVGPVGCAKRLPYSDHIVYLGPNGVLTAQSSFTELNDASGYVSSFSLPRADWSYILDNDKIIEVNDHDKELESVAIARRKGSESGVSLTSRSSETSYAPRNGETDTGRRIGNVQIYLQMIITMVPLSGEKFHFVLLNTVLSAPISFFVKTDSGVTLNRFSQDLQLIDMELPIAALNTFATFVLYITQIVLIGIGSIYAAISFPIVLAALYFIQKVYLHTSRQLHLMDLGTKAPLYSLFEEPLSGLPTIRAFGWQDALEEKNHELLDRSQRPFYLLFTLRGTVAAGGVGLALLNTTLETHIGSVARIRSFTETAVPEDQPEEKQMPPPGWPSTGTIEFKNLSAAYSQDDLVLKDVSLSIIAGEKIAVCGRTGSDKTSLIMTIFRLVNIAGGSIIVDGVDIATLPRQEVRSQIVAVPQHPFLLKGSVRLNADPMGIASDEDIIAALQCVQIKEVVDKNCGLDADIDSLNLSSRQRQLLCLARAMLRPSSILILDEATSSIDAKTEETMQRLIRRKFANHTIIAVAHKLETILDFDKVAVLDAGRLVEFDSPYALLDVPDSAFSRLSTASVADTEEDLDLGFSGKK